jgi:hypothetical protein
MAPMNPSPALGNLQSVVGSNTTTHTTPSHSPLQTALQGGSNTSSGSNLTLGAQSKSVPPAVPAASQSYDSVNQVCAREFLQTNCGEWTCKLTTNGINFCLCATDFDTSTTSRFGPRSGSHRAARRGGGRIASAAGGRLCRDDGQRCVRDSEAQEGHDRRHQGHSAAPWYSTYTHAE